MSEPVRQSTPAKRAKRDFLSFADVTEAELLGLLARAAALKASRHRDGARREGHASLAGQTLAMVFEKASTRTRVSFEVGMFELGGHAIFLGVEGSQLGRGEPIADTARVLAGYTHGIMIRTFGQARVEELARYASVPVINGLTDQFHPCQLVADLLTVQERRGTGSLGGLRYAWIGDGNNMAHSWIEAAALLGLDLVLATPAGYDPDPAIVAAARAQMSKSGRGKLELVRDPRDAARGAHVLSTDVWASMGQEQEAAARRQAFAGFCLDAQLLSLAAADPVVLHCLPAHRGEEISEEVLEGPHSAVWQQAENRLHTQKAILELFLGLGR
jgi:ornithine carbamoyltransferase